jgi:hypothetical protein
MVPSWTLIPSRSGAATVLQRCRNSASKPLTLRLMQRNVPNKSGVLLTVRSTVQSVL